MSDAQDCNVDVVWNWILDQMRRGLGESHANIAVSWANRLGRDGMVEIARRYWSVLFLAFPALSANVLQQSCQDDNMPTA